MQRIAGKLGLLIIVLNKLQMTSTKIQINYNNQKFNDQNSFGHFKIDIWILFVICYLLFVICYLSFAFCLFT